MLYVRTMMANRSAKFIFLDMSQHSHEIGPANLPFTRRGRKAAVQRDKERTQKEATSDDLSTSSNNAIAGPSSQSDGLYSSAVSMLAPLPSQPQYQQQPPPPTFTYPSMPVYGPPPVHPTHDRWENMATLFHSIRENARGYEYPPVSVAALESILIRLYLESPPTGQATVIQNGMRPLPPPPQSHRQTNGASSSAGTDGINGDDSS